MKIAIISDPFVPVPPPLYGGSEKVTHYLIKGLMEAGHEPILLATGDSQVACKLIPTVEKAMSVPSNRKNLPYFRIRYKRVLNRTEKLLNKLLPEIDVIHSMGFDLKNFSKFPNVTTLHNPIVINSRTINERDIDYFKERQGLNYVTISKNQRDAYPKLNYIRVVYNGEDPEEFPLIKRPQNYVCFVGRFDRDKNPHLAIQLAVKYGIKIKLGGKIGYLGNEYFRNELRPLLNHPLVDYLGELNKNEIIELVSKARCNLHPTGFREPFGLSVLEAAYCGTPTLAIARGSMPELIEDGKTGKIVEDFVEGFHYLEECFKLDREYIAKRSRKKFNYHNMTDGYLHAYKKAIKIQRKSKK